MKERKKRYLAEYKRFAYRIEHKIGLKQICESKVIGFLIWCDKSTGIPIGPEKRINKVSLHRWSRYTESNLDHI